MSGREIEVFVGAATDVEARVYARCEDGLQSNGVQLSGTLSGPHCKYAHTLPALMEFRDLGPGATALAEAVVPDPCSWSVELPHLYNVEVKARRGDEIVSGYRGCVGIRRLAVRDDDLFWDSKRWVIRGAVGATTDLGPWREQGLAMLVHDPDDELCEAASRTGVLLIADVTDAESLGRLARWPAVGLAILPHEVENVPENLLTAQRFVASEPLWADIVVCENADSNGTAEQLIASGKPVIAVRNDFQFESLAEARAACDRLQRDLAPMLDLAGYIVG